MSFTNFTSPTKEIMDRSADMLQKRILPSLLNQEQSHANSKRPVCRRAGLANMQIQRVLKSTSEVKSKLRNLDKDFRMLEEKIDRLELEKQKHLIHCLGTPVSSESQSVSTPQQKYLQMSSVILSPLPSPPLNSCDSSDYQIQLNRIDNGRKTKLNELSIKRLQTRLNSTCGILEDLFRDNFTILKYRRAEKCVLKMVKIQRQLKGLQASISQLYDRLLQ